MALELVEPLRMLFKDEVRALGLGLPRRLWSASVSGSGPGDPYTWRDYRRETGYLACCRYNEIRNHGLYDEIWQAFARLPAGKDGRRNGRCPFL